MDLTALVPHWCGLHFIHAVPQGDRLTLVAYTTARMASCPLCQQPASSVHSRYQRRVADLPCGGRALTHVINASG
jgi:hypothetical protein